MNDIMRREGGKNIPMQKLRSEKTNSEVACLQDTPLNSQKKRKISTPKNQTLMRTSSQSALMRMSSNSGMKKTIVYKDVPWNTITLDEKYQDPYSKQCMIRTQSALGFKMGETMRGIVDKSREVNYNLNHMLSTQRDPTFLKQAGLY
jgi:hypothetical protein